MAKKQRAMDEATSVMLKERQEHIKKLVAEY
jgi:hypothetical protein